MGNFSMQDTWKETQRQQKYNKTDSEVEECSTKSLKDPFETKWHLRWGLHVLESIVII